MDHIHLNRVNSDSRENSILRMRELFSTIHEIEAFCDFLVELIAEDGHEAGCRFLDSLIEDGDLSAACGHDLQAAICQLAA